MEILLSDSICAEDTDEQNKITAYYEKTEQLPIIERTLLVHMLHRGRKHNRNKNRRPLGFVKVLKDASRLAYKKLWIKQVKPVRGVTLTCDTPNHLFQYVDTLSEAQLSVTLARHGFSDEELDSMPDVVRRLILFDTISKLRGQ